jgi:hypothetical protein
MKPGAVTNPAVLVEAHVDRVDTRAFGALAHERHRFAVVGALLVAADVLVDAPIGRFVGCVSAVADLDGLAHVGAYLPRV